MGMYIRVIWVCMCIYMAVYRGHLEKYKGIQRGSMGVYIMVIWECT